MYACDELKIKTDLYLHIYLRSIYMIPSQRAMSLVMNGNFHPSSVHVWDTNSTERKEFCLFTFSKVVLAESFSHNQVGYVAKEVRL